MADTVSKSTRSVIMSRVKQKNTKPEIILRSILHKNGFRFRLNCNDLPGSPDIVLVKHEVAIFVHGCFWHQHRNCKKAKRPSTNMNYWNNKLDENIKRDSANMLVLKRSGWKIMVCWECEIIKNPQICLQRLVNLISKKTTKKIAAKS